MLVLVTPLIDALRTCHPIPVKHYPNFETLNANTATALKKILTLTVKLGWNSNNVNVHPVPLKARSPEKLMDVSVFTKMILCPAACRSKRTTRS